MWLAYDFPHFVVISVSFLKSWLFFFIIQLKECICDQHITPRQCYFQFLFVQTEEGKKNLPVSSSCFLLVPTDRILSKGLEQGVLEALSKWLIS